MSGPPKINEVEAKVLGALGNHDQDFNYRGFAAICADTGLDRKQVRRACRSLARKGLAAFGRGLWTEEGYPAGSGYCATPASVQWLVIKQAAE